VIDDLIQQQITVKMAKCRQLSPHRAAINCIGKEFLDKIANIIPASALQLARSLL